MTNEFDYRMVTDDERKEAIFPGDPVGDYLYFPEAQEQILAAEAEERKAQASVVQEIGGRGKLEYLARSNHLETTRRYIERNPEIAYVELYDLYNSARSDAPFHDETYKVLIEVLGQKYDVEEITSFLDLLASCREKAVAFSAYQRRYTLVDS